SDVCSSDLSRRRAEPRAAAHARLPLAQAALRGPLSEGLPLTGPGRFPIYAVVAAAATVVGSAGEAALAQVIRLLRGVPAAEQRVAMREASEAPDDLAVAADAFGAPGVDARAERHRERLVGRILRMGEGNHEEHPEAGLHARHVPQPLRFAREHPRQAVGGVHVRGAAEGIARELVEQ